MEKITTNEYTFNLNEIHHLLKIPLNETITEFNENNDGDLVINTTIKPVPEEKVEE